MTIDVSCVHRLLWQSIYWVLCVNYSFSHRLCLSFTSKFYWQHRFIWMSAHSSIKNIQFFKGINLGSKFFIHFLGDPYLVPVYFTAAFIRFHSNYTWMFMQLALRHDIHNNYRNFYWFGFKTKYFPYCFCRRKHSVCPTKTI